MKMEKLIPLYDEFYESVCKVSEDIDPHNNHNWSSLSIGWALAKGLNSEDALQFAQYARFTKYYEKN